MKKTKWLAACMAACALALVAGCSSGDDDKPYLPGILETDEPELPGIKYDPAKWVIEGTTVVRYTGAEADVRIPDGVTAIGENAFRDCTSLASVTIPDSVESIGERAFQNCTSLAEVTIGDGVESIEYAVFFDCTSLASVTIPASVKSIEYGAFYYCTSLAEVKYGGTLAQWCQMDNDMHLVRNATSIKLSDGSDLKSLTTLEIPSGVTQIGAYAFDGCTSLAEVKYGGTLAQWCQMDNDSYLMDTATSIKLSDGSDLKSLTTLEIPSGVTKIGAYAFRECTSLASVEIPGSVKSIGYGAFWSCNILDITYGGTLSQWCQMDNDWSLMSFATSIKLSDGSDLKSLTTLEIPSDVTSIGNAAFYECASLASVTIPGSVTSIGGEAFNNCTSLAEVTIPASVTSIGWSAFNNCTSLAEVTIPASVTSIGYGAFNGCASLTDVKYGGTAEQWKQIDIASYVFPDDVTIYDKEGKEITE